jgi:hypothetical protein
MARAKSKKSPAKSTRTAAKKTAPKKTGTKKKTTAKKTAAKKTAAKKTTAKKTAAKKTAAKKTAAKKTVKTASRKTAAKKTARKPRRGGKSIQSHELFRELTEGERADSLRLLLEDRRLANMAKVGRYRVISAEPLVFKAHHPLGDHRVARVVVYDYASNRCVQANVDLDAGEVLFLSQNQAQPALSLEEELAAIQTALSEGRVNEKLSLGDKPLAAMHYWSRKDADLAHHRRSAAVIFGPPDSRPTLVAVVDLVDGVVTEVVPGEQW